MKVLFRDTPIAHLLCHLTQSSWYLEIQVPSASTLHLAHQQSMASGVYLKRAFKIQLRNAWFRSRVPSNYNIKLPDTFGNSKKDWINPFFCTVLVWPLWILELRLVRSVPIYHAMPLLAEDCNVTAVCGACCRQNSVSAGTVNLFHTKANGYKYPEGQQENIERTFQVLAMTMMPEVTIYISFRKWSGWGRGWCSTGVKRFDSSCSKCYFSPL